MDLKKIVQDVRASGNLKGKYSCVVKVPSNYGRILQRSKGFYVLTLRSDDSLYFHGLSRFRLKYQKEKDFAIDLTLFKNYSFSNFGKNLRELRLINGEDFLPIDIFTGIKSSYEGEANMSSICKHLESLGIKEVFDHE